MNVNRKSGSNRGKMPVWISESAWLLVQKARNKEQASRIDTSVEDKTPDKLGVGRMVEKLLRERLAMPDYNEPMPILPLARK